MGNTLTACATYLVAFYIKLQEQSKALLWGEQKQKNYFNNDILLKDDEQKAGKNIKVFKIFLNFFRYFVFRRNKQNA